MGRIWDWLRRPLWQDVATAPTNEVIRQCLLFAGSFTLLAGAPFVFQGRWLFGLLTFVGMSVVVLPMGFIRRSNARQKLKDEEERGTNPLLK